MRLPFDFWTTVFAFFGAVFLLALVIRLGELTVEELERPSPPPNTPTTGPLEPPGWFAPPHERMLYDLEINRTETELVLSQTEQAQARAAYIRATRELDEAAAESNPVEQDNPLAAAEALTRDDIARLISIVPELTPEQRDLLLRLVDARLEEIRS